MNKSQIFFHNFIKIISFKEIY